MTSQNSAPPQLAVWYFVGATFLFTSPLLFFRDAPPWVAIVTFALGGVAMVLGGLQLAREISHRKGEDSAPQDDVPPTA